jgi:hypothetical protein
MIINPIHHMIYISSMAIKASQVSSTHKVISINNDSDVSTHEDTVDNNDNVMGDISNIPLHILMVTPGCVDLDTLTSWQTPRGAGNLDSVSDRHQHPANIAPPSLVPQPCLMKRTHHNGLSSAETLVSQLVPWAYAEAGTEHLLEASCDTIDVSWLPTPHLLNAEHSTKTRVRNCPPASLGS